MTGAARTALHLEDSRVWLCAGPSADGAVKWEVLDDPADATLVAPAPVVDGDRLRDPFDNLCADVVSALDRLDVPGAAAAVVVVHPTVWGARRIDQLVTALTRCTGGAVDALPAAGAAAHCYATQRGLGSAGVAVLEIGTLGTSASFAVWRSGESVLIAAEHEPGLGAADLTAGAAPEPLIALVESVIGDDMVDAVLVLGEAVGSAVDALREHLADNRHGVALAVLSGRELTSGMWGGQGESTPRRPLPPQRPEPLSALVAGNLREVGARPRPRRRRIAVAAAAFVLLALAATGAVALTSGSGTVTDSADPPAPATVVPAPATAPADRTAPRIELTRASAELPAGWETRPPATAPAERIVLVPRDTAPARITMVQNTLAAEAGYDTVENDLRAKIAAADPGRFGGLRRDVVVGGRPGLAYDEFPGDDSQVAWHVIIDRGVQLNIGCQYRKGRWELVQAACDQVVRSMIVQP